VRPGERLRRLLAVYPGEGERIALLSLHSLLNGVFIAFFFAAANGLFLELFPATALPWSYVVSSLVGFGAASFFARLQRRLPFGRLLTLDLGALLAVVTGFWLAFSATGNRWIAFAMFVSIVPAMGLLSLEFWGLAMRLLDLRQSKRLFGLVGAGEVAATIVGFLLVPALLGLLPGAIHLLPIAAAGLAGCLAVAGRIRRRFPDEVAGRGAPARPAAAAPAGAPAAEAAAEARLRGLVRRRYFGLLAGLMVVTVLVNYYVDFSFLSQLKLRYPTSESLARFIGFFFAGVKGTELLLRTFLAGRLLTVFGLRFGLLLLPAALLACVALVLGGGSAAGYSTVLVFALIAFTKLTWLVLRDSIFEPSFRTLYQPLEPATRLAFQIRVEGGVKQAAILLVGIALLVFHRTGALQASYLFAALLPLVLSWLVLALMAHADYRSLLLANLAPRAAGPEADREGAEIARILARRPPEVAVEALARLARIDRGLAVPALVELLEEAPGHRTAGLELLARLRAPEGRAAAERLAAGPAEPAVRAAARRALDRLDEVERLAASPEGIAAALRSAAPEDRALAAAALGRARTEEAGARLAELLWDREAEVRRAALLAAGESGSAALRRRIVAHLSQSAFSAAAVRAAAAAGEPILEDLEALLSRSSSDRELRYRTLRICQEIGGAGAVEVLFDNLASSDPQAQGQALRALTVLRSRAGPAQAAAIEARIERVVGMAAWNLAALVDLGGFPPARWVTESLVLELKRNRATLYGLLKLLFEPGAIERVERELEHGGPETAVYALEMLDLVVSRELGPLVVPILERLPPAQAVTRLDPVAPQERLAPVERLRAVVHRDYSRIRAWTRASALHALGRLPEDRLAKDCIAHLFNPDPLVQEVAAYTLHRRDPAVYRRCVAKLLNDRARLDRVLGMGENGAGAGAGGDPRMAARRWHARSRFGRAVFYRRIPVLAGRPPETAVALAEISDGDALAAGELLATAPSGARVYRAVMEGRLASETTGEEFAPGTWLGRSGRGGPYRALEPTAVVRLEEEGLFEFLADHPDLVPRFLELEGGDLPLS
jgi:AAA family ATP:ADP antiporter